MSSENLLHSDLPVYNGNACLVFLEHLKSKQELITLVTQKTWQVRFLSEDIAVVSESISTSSCDLESYEMINEIQGATIGRPNKTISINGSESLLTEFKQLWFPKSQYEMIHRDSNNLITIIFTDVSTKLRYLGEILLDLVLSEQVIRSSLVDKEEKKQLNEMKELEITANESTKDEIIICEDKNNDHQDDNNLESLQEVQPTTQIIEEIIDNSNPARNNIISSSITSQVSELNRKRKSSEVSTATVDNGDNLRKKIHRSKICSVATSVLQYIALAAIFSGIIFAFSQNFGSGDLNTLRQFFSLENINPFSGNGN